MTKASMKRCTLCQQPLPIDWARITGGLPTIAAMERLAIVNRLDHHDGNRVATAASLGISRTTLWRKLRAYRVRDAHDGSRRP